MHSLVGAAIFLCLVLGGVAATWRKSGQVSSQRTINLFVVYVLGVSSAIGFVQTKIFFPFHSWILLGQVGPDSAVSHYLLAVDSVGQEHRVDFRAWEPVSFYELRFWLEGDFQKLTPAERRTIGEHLLASAEQARSDARAGRRIGSFHRRLGAASAPLFATFPKIWSDSAEVPLGPFVALRWYEERWSVLERNTDPGAVTRVLREEYQPRE